MNRPSLDEFIKANEKIFDVCCNEIPIQVGLKLTQEQTLVLSIYYTVIELSAGVIATMKQGQYVCSVTLLRSLMEYFTELLYLLKNPREIDKLNATATIEQKKLINEIDESKHETFSELKSSPEFAARVDEVNEEAEDKYTLDFKFRLKDVGLEDWYTLYRCFSADAHPNISRYKVRYCRINTKGVLTHYTTSVPNRDESEIWTSKLAEILIVSTIKLHEFLPDGDPDVMQKKFDMLKDIWK